MYHHSNFRNLVGLTKEQFNIVFGESSAIFSRKHPLMFKKWEEILLLTLYNFKNYPTEWDISFIFSIPRTTVDRWTQIGVETLVEWANERFKYPSKEERIKQAIIMYDDLLTTVVVDCTEQHVVTSTIKEIEDSTFGGKYMDRTVSLLVGCCVLNGKIVYISSSREGK